jgi:hypothetical protein
LICVTVSCELGDGSAEFSKYPDEQLPGYVTAGQSMWSGVTTVYTATVSESSSAYPSQSVPWYRVHVYVTWIETVPTGTECHWVSRNTSIVV